MVRIKKILCVVLSLMILISAFGQMTVTAFAADDTITVGAIGKYGQTEARSMLKMINDFRKGSDAWYWNESGKKIKCSNLNNLVYDYDLEKAAMQRAAEIALSFSHTRPNGEICFTALSENIYYPVGENIAAGYSDATSTFVGWREDDYDFYGQGHRRNMLSSDFTAVGIGHFYSNGYHYWVQEFGNPNVDTKATTANNSNTTVPIEILKSNITDVDLEVSKSSFTLTEGKTATLPSATAYLGIRDCWPYGYAEVTLTPTWKTSNSDIISISGNKVTANGAGKATATAKVTIGSLSDSQKVSVTVNHDYETIELKKATLSKNGTAAKKCKVCGDTTEVTIAYPKTVELSTTSYTYNGKVKKPSVTVKDSNGNKIASSTYTVTYPSGRKNVGKYTVTIKFKDNYSGTVKRSFTIKPKSTSISKVTAKKKGFTVQWKKQATQTTGYEIQYAANSKFTKNKKTVTVSKNQTTSKTITKLSANKKYYVRVRTYKTVKVNGKSTKIYSSWSKYKTVTTKK